MAVLVDERISELSDVYDATRSVDVAAHIPEASFGVVGTRHGDHAFTSMDVAERVGQAVIDGYREATGDRLPVDLDDPTVRLEAYCYDDRFTLAVDLTDESLHKRPYRVCEHDAPLRATLAYSMLRLAGYSPDDRLVDPMAGSATIPIEAALAATGRVPCPDHEPAFGALPRYDEARFRRRRAAHEPRDAPVDIEARERRERWRRCARTNREAADLEEAVDIVDADAREATLDADCVVTNLPFGGPLRRLRRPRPGGLGRPTGRSHHQPRTAAAGAPRAPRDTVRPPGGLHRRLGAVSAHTDGRPSARVARHRYLYEQSCNTGFHARRYTRPRSARRRCTSLILPRRYRRQSPQYDT
ncbi:hypothetical protein BRD07_07000 [Halobacteriales archaeon QS_9_68_42]|nr:MAG: hypothetical protein BRD07_07000 [Halobacteriales archaeon QS_9_68_42]